MRYVFKHEYRQNHLILLEIIDLLFTWIQKQSRETENRDTEVYRCWQDRFVRIWKIMVQFFFRSLRTKSEPIGEEKNKQERDEWFPTQTEQSFYYDNNFTNFSTVHWQMWAFKTKLRSSKFLLAFHSNTLLKNTGSNSRGWGVYSSSKNGLKFFCVSRGNLRPTLFWPGPVRIQGYWPKWRPSTQKLIFSPVNTSYFYKIHPPPPHNVQISNKYIFYAFYLIMYMQPRTQCRKTGTHGTAAKFSKIINGPIYTRDGSSVWDELGQRTIVRLIIRLCINTGFQTDHPSRRTNTVVRLDRRTTALSELTVLS